MKRISLLTITILLLCLRISYSQTGPMGGAIGATSWNRGGNSFTTGNNIFGTATGFNSSIFTITNGLYRIRLNGTSSYNVNGYTGNRDEYFLLGQNASTTIGTRYGTANAGAFSLLHLSGPNPGDLPRNSATAPGCKRAGFNKKP